MTLGELRKLLAKVPDNEEINFRDPNYGGIGEKLDGYAIEITEKFGVLIHPPHWTPVD